MKKNYFLKTCMLIMCLFVGMSAWAEDVTGTITFGTNNVKINAASVSGDDNLGNSWTITTAGTSSFTANQSYYQVGASKSPASSITFTTTLSESVTIKSMSAKFGGFTSTAGSVNLKVGETTIGTGSLNATNDVTVTSTSSAAGTVLTVTVTGIDKGVKVYNISYTYSTGDSPTPTVTAPTFDVAAGTYTEDQLVLIKNYNDDYLYAYTTDGSTPAFDADLNVTNGTAYDNNEGIEITSSCTLKVIAVDEDGNKSSVASAAYVINKPFASLEALVAADLATGTNVTVSFENVPIKAFQTVSSTRKGVYFDIQKAGKDIEIYFNTAVPTEWVEGGTLSGTMTACPWKLYNGTWELAPATGWAWTNLTYTAPAQKTITSLTISGTPTKTSYYVGDAFETAGLVVTATYDDETQTPITEGIEWTIDPEVLALGTTSVDVIAGVGSVVSDVYTVNGLSVTENPYKTATISTFSAISGEINSDISYEAFKGGATSAPIINNNNLRLYQGGGYVTIKAAKGLKINSVKVTTSATYASTTVGYCVDDDDAPTTGTTVAKSTSYTISDLENESVSIYCLGTDNTHRLEISKIEVTYSGEAALALKSIALSGTYPTEFTTADEFSQEGMTVTATYTDNSSKDVTSEAEISGYDMTTIGEQTVTVSYTEDGVTKTAQYTITITKAPFVPTSAAEGYETANFAALYSSVTTSATVEDYEGTSFAMAFAKPESSSNPTKYYDNGTAVRAYSGNTITITGAENIEEVEIVWSSNSYTDDEVSITGLGTTTAVVTFSNTCRFTSINVYYRDSHATIAVNSKAQYGTFCAPFDVTVPAGVTASTATLDGQALVLESVGSTIPANTPVVLYAEAGLNATIVCGNAVDGEPTAGVLTGVYTATAAPEDSYVLQLQSEKVGFYQVGAVVPTVGANRAYLTAPATASARAFFFDAETAISTIEALTSGKAEIYNINGVKLNGLQKGINIVNGKKIMVK